MRGRLEHHLDRGRFDCGNLINSDLGWRATSSRLAPTTSRPTDHRLPRHDAEYALLIYTWGAERRYVQGGHDAVGRISFVHANCSTYYESGTDTGEKIKGGEPGVDTPESFTGSDVGNRPGANCAAMTIDGFGASPAVDVTYDGTKPTLGFTAPAGAPATVVGATGPSYTVTFNATDAVAKFSASKPWTLKRQVAANTGAGA